MRCDAGDNRGFDAEAAVVRIADMERCFDELAAAFAAAPETVLADEYAAGLYEKLNGYCAGGLWKSDFEADEAGLLPAGLNRGVLSEDGLYNLLLEIDAYKIG